MLLRTSHILNIINNNQGLIWKKITIDDPGHVYYGRWITLVSLRSAEVDGRTEYEVSLGASAIDEPPMRPSMIIESGYQVEKYDNHFQ